MRAMRVLEINNGKISIGCSDCDIERIVKVSRGGLVFTATCQKCGKKQRMRTENRKSVRKKFETDGLIKIDARNDLRVKILDISTGGLAFGSSFGFELGSEVQISFTLHFSKRDKKEFVHTIEIISRNGNKYGAQFLDLIDYSPEKKDIHWWTLDTPALSM